MEYWINAESAGHYFFYIFPVCLVILFVIFAGRRVRFLCPSVLITFVIANPWFYKYWEKLGLYAYWRMLWIIPVIPVVAGLFPAVAEKLSGELAEKTRSSYKNKIADIGKYLITIAGIICVVFCGTFVYSASHEPYKASGENNAKVPEHVVRIANKLLALNDHPRVILQDPLGVYIRQYSGEIDCLFGRNINPNHIGDPGIEAMTVNNILDNPEGDMSYISQFMLDDGYDYLVCKKEAGKHFELIDTISDYGIYKAIGTPRIQKERNELGQVVKNTTLDKDGRPQNGAGGYSTIIRDYNSYGDIVYEYHVDTDGNAVPDGNGQAGFIREYDDYSHIIMEKSLGTNGKAINNPLGYAEVRTEYSNGRIIQESFYDAKGNPVNSINGYYKHIYNYDNSGNLTGEKYVDSSGKKVNAPVGFAEKKCSYQSGKLTKEEYYDANGDPLVQAAGHVAIAQTWDGDNLTSRTYLDRDGQPVNRVDGYSRAEWRQDDHGTWNVRFYDAGGRDISNAGQNLTKDVMCGLDGWSEWMMPETDTENRGFHLGFLNLGKKAEGDIYYCQIEIEFRNVRASNFGTFQLWGQGTADNSWTIGNVWNVPLVFENAPDNGTILYKWSNTVNEAMVDASDFTIGLRCDYWGSGVFRVRDIQVQSIENDDIVTPGI